MTVKLCECGCGEPAPIAKWTDTRWGAVKGEPQRYVRGHHMRTQHGIPTRRGIPADRAPRPAAPPLYELDPATECWIWQGRTNGEGYGTLNIGGRAWMAHRWFYVQEIGSLPPMLDHACRNKLCVNPSHLRPTTDALNQQNLAAWRERGPRGVNFHRGMWHAKVVLSGVAHRLGKFATREEAAAVAAAFRAEHMPYSPEAMARRDAA